MPRRLHSTADPDSSSELVGLLAPADSSASDIPELPSIPVELNIYDLQHPDNPDAVPTVNWYLYPVGMGLYHSGVCVYGREFCYGGHPASSTGIFSVAPKKAPDARYRQTLLIGNTQLSRGQIDDLIQDMSEVWAGNAYNLLTQYVPFS